MKNLKKSRLPLPLAMTSVSKFLVIAPRNQDILSHSHVKWLFSILILRTFIETGLFFIGKSFSEALIFSSTNPQYDDKCSLNYKFYT